MNLNYRLKFLSLATATLMLSLTSPFLPLNLKLEPLVVQAQTLEQLEPGAEKWYLEAYQLWLKGDYPASLTKLQQDLARFKQEGDRAREGAVLASMGMIYCTMGQYTQALEYSQQALALLREVGKLPNGNSLPDSSASRSTARTWEGKTLNIIGLIYVMLGQYTQSLDYSQQALAINREVGDRIWEGKSFWNIGFVYKNQGQYAKALEFFQKTLAIDKEVGHRVDQGIALNSIGSTYSYLGQYAKALEFLQQALAIHKEVGPKIMEGAAFNNLGNVYFGLEKYSKALESYQQALAIHRKVGDKREEGVDLTNIGVVYSVMGQYPKALEFSQQALVISRDIGDKAMEGWILAYLGIVYYKLEQKPKALELYQQALAISREIGDKPLEGENLTLIGLLLEAQNQPELAIAFYKQSVNVTEGIRKDLRVLPKDLQKSYTEKVAVTYRRLADLLLKQDRILEAQRVIDLLKVQELEDYLRNVRGSDNSAQGIVERTSEQQIKKGYGIILDKAIELGKELSKLRSIPPDKRTEVQRQRVFELRKNEDEIAQQFRDFLKSPEVMVLIEKLKNNKGEPLDIEKEALILQGSLKQLQQKAVILYPFVLDDRIELILVTSYAPPIRRTVAVKREELNRAIGDFRSALKNPTTDAKIPAQKLYNWLIKPLEKDLTQSEAKTIIYAPDGQLRYIPLAALHDGKEWLVQKFSINNITALSLTNLNTKPQQKLQVFAGAFVNGSYKFQVGEQKFAFNGLEYAGVEVENLVKTFPGTTKVLDQQFNPDTIFQMNDYSVVHLATHGAFVEGKPEDSFILFGDGKLANFRDIGRWRFPDVDLVVLSACETGLGDQLGDGKEILGFGYLMQQTGAKAAIASLWSVSDGGTQILMNTFYTALKNGTSKAEALRQAQIALITKDLSAVGGSRGEEAWIELVSTRTGLPKQVSNNLSHPYYWAPFILIGNGL